MTVPISEELNVRERIERLFETSASDVDLEAVAICLEEASGQLVSAIAAFTALDFELGGPDVKAWSPGDVWVVGADQIEFQMLRAPTGTQFRCSLSSELVGVLIKSGFGGPALTADMEFDCSASDFCNFFISNVALAIVREIASSVTGVRSQNVVFDTVVEYAEDASLETPREPGFRATWQLVLADASYSIAVYLPGTEFHRLATRTAGCASEATDEVGAPGWADRMQLSLAATEVQLRAIMNRPDMPLEQLSKLQVGDVVEFTDPQSTSVLLECDGEPLFACDVGQKDGCFAVHVKGEV